MVGPWYFYFDVALRPCPISTAGKGWNMRAVFFQHFAANSPFGSLWSRIADELPLTSMKQAGHHAITKQAVHELFKEKAVGGLIMGLTERALADRIDRMREAADMRDFVHDSRWR
jgi:hypothetical protein